ncbi:Mov34/MPN/PAD-1 family protein [Thermoproteota archaeon]
MKRKEITLLKKAVHKVFPFEACAILFGEMSHDEAYVSKIYLASNRLKSEVRFEIEPEDVFEAFMEAEEEGLELVGFFHSHQTHVKPSLLDINNMKLWGNAVWLIFASRDDSLAAYQLFNEKLLETSIIIEDEMSEREQ